MPVNILLTFIIGSALGWVLVKITRTPKHLQGLVISCCSAGNLGNLLLIIIPAVCDDTNSPFGDSSTCTTNGDAYASLSMAIGAVYIWSYVYNIIRLSGSKSDGNINGNVSISPEEALQEALLSKDSSRSEDLQEALLSKESSRSEDYEAQTRLSGDNVTAFGKIKQHMKNFAEAINLKMLFAPSTIATIVGLLIGVITPLRKIMIGDSAPLRVVESFAVLLGEAAIPSMTLIVGANLLKGLKGSGIGFWVVIGVNVVRYIALPFSGILVVKAAHYFGYVGSDSLYQFVLLLQYALPSAMTIEMEFEHLGMGNEVIEFDMMGLGDEAIDIEHTINEDEDHLVENSYDSIGGGTAGRVQYPCDRVSMSRTSRLDGAIIQRSFVSKRRSRGIMPGRDLGGLQGDGGG
ncbi:auxin efflux carrier family protein [Actinidia rufa]|uniref:Auxin efflux carrier family protein n=1 Tax=Actinidia rufa TaxID=165716 RepID=A0A7J0GFE0_9ERIC|nr:auxin efflux carrier family protein [Actinidia rufa]